MNTIYNVVWNSTTGTWVVASEMAKGRKKKAKAASAATAAMLVTATGLSVGAMLMPGTAAAAPGFCASQRFGDSYSTLHWGGFGATSGFTNATCYAMEPEAGMQGVKWGILDMQTHSLAFINATTNNANQVSAMWLDGDAGTINFDVGAQYGQIIKINPNGRMNGLTDGEIAAGSTDAITGNQAFQLKSKIEEISNGGGGSVKYFHANSTLADSAASGDNAIAVGGAANAVATNAVAIGREAWAGGEAGLAAGSNAVSRDAGDIALGASSEAKGGGQYATALGASSRATAIQSTSIGAFSEAKHDYSVALGQNSTTDRSSSVSVGNASSQRQVTFVAKGTADTDAVNVSQLKGVTTALGGGADVNGEGTITAPTYNVAGGSYDNVESALAAVDAKAGSGGGSNKYFHTNTVLDDSVTTGADSIAVGGNAVSEGKWSVAMGTNAKASADNSVALGNSSLADRANSVSVGNATVQRQVTFVAKGTADTDAVNVSQLKGVTTALGGGADVNGEGTITAPTYNVAGGSYDNVESALAAVDAKAGSGGGSNKYFHANSSKADSSATGVDAIAIGDGAVATAEDNLALGSDAKALGGPESGNNIAIGDMATAGISTMQSANNVAVGSHAGATGGYATALGFDSHATGLLSTALGTGATSSAESSVAIGGGSSRASYANASARKAVAIGAGSQAAGEGGVALGSDSVADRNDAVSVGSAVAGSTFTRQIVNVGKGTLDNDAVNVSQLKGVLNNVIGGGAVDNDGNITKPSITVGGNSYGTVAEAIDAASKLGGGGNALAVAYDDTSKAKITLNPAGAATTITNVADGKVEAGSKDAVNGGQLSGAVDTITTAVKEIAPKLKYIKFGQSTAADAQASGIDSTAIGGNAFANGTGALALGLNARATANKALAAGAGALAGAASAVSLGEGASALGVNSVALGAGSATAPGDSWVVSVGNLTNKRRITNLADGIGASDAATVGQVNSIVDKAVSGKSRLLSPLMVTPKAGTVPVDKLIAAGPTTLADQIEATGENALAIGLNTHATADNAVAAGQNVVVVAKDAVGVGQNVVNNGERAVVIGSNVSAIANDATVIGTSSAVDAVDGVAIGAFAYVKPDAAGSVAIGRETQALAKGTVVLGQGSTDDNRANTVSVGTTLGTAVKRQIINVAKGTQDNDAVNVSQLKDSLTKVVGGSTPATVDKDGNITQPTFKIDGKDTHSVGEALDAVAALAATGSANGIKYDSDAHDKVTFDGAAGTTLTGLKDGAVAAGSKDAITGNQLFGASKSVADIIGGGSTVGPDGKVTTPNGIVVGGQKYDDLTKALDGLDGKIGTGSALGVAYDDATRTKVTLNKGGDTGPVTIANVKAGVGDDEAVNVKQLKDAGLIDGSGKALDAVVYDAGSNKASVSFGGASGTVLKNVGAGKVNVASMEGINGSQLFGTAQSVADAIGGKATVDTDGKVTKPTINVGGKDFNTVADAIGAVEAIAGTGNALGVAYDDASKASVTLNKNGGAVTVANVKNGVADDHATNLGQLKPVIAGLGGGAKVDPATGVVTGPTYNLTKVDGTTTTVNNVGDAVTNLDQRTAQNTTNITNVLSGKAGLVQQTAAGEKLTVGKDTDGTEVDFKGKAGDRKLTGVAKGTADNDAVNVKQLKDAGLVDGNGNVANAVTYDTDAKDSITLGGVGSKKPVTLKNVADGTKDDEAINLGQLKKAGLAGEDGKVLDAVVYDAGSNKGSVTFGGMNGTVLDNVADGRIGAGSRQAINGGQIAAIKDALEGKITNIDNRVTKVEQNGGGGGGYPGYINANGSGGSPKPASAGDTAGVALGYDSNASGVGASAIGDHAKAEGMDSMAIGNNASTTATGANSVALGNGSVADRANTVSVGSEGHERTISNVARGSADHDAVNYQQMDERIREVGASANAYTDKLVNDVWSNLSEEIDHSNRQANRGIAAASALINVTPYVPGHTTVNAGVAGYRGESALGVGVSRWTENGRVNLNAGVSAAQGDEPVFRVGVGYIF